MHKSFKFPSVISLVLVSLLQACGGGEESSKNPLNQSQAVTKGIVTGFGSIVVDENEIEDGLWRQFLSATPQNNTRRKT